ncbi:unnamed protein product [Ambrosiozyma monospora]|uniref:Unnamed protein product n=1 Tax=Ambrosiozyma monospora TaxID=43982 RepID=A0A9W7DMB6_AMBMO|nr:unnamed protein product [Ambrosiozyma monospora]
MMAMMDHGNDEQTWHTHIWSVLMIADERKLTDRLELCSISDKTNEQLKVQRCILVIMIRQLIRERMQKSGITNTCAPNSRSCAYGKSKSKAHVSLTPHGRLKFQFYLNFE